MTDKAISPLRQRMIEDMTIRKLAPKTQQGYVRNVKDFAAFLSRSPDTASLEEVRGFRLHLAGAAHTSPFSIIPWSTLGDTGRLSRSWHLDRVQGRPRDEIETDTRPASGLRLSDHVAEFRGRTDPSQSHAGDPVDR